jgi:hypothetical protein
MSALRRKDSVQRSSPAIKLDASANVRADVTLEVGTTTTAVEVAAAGVCN